MSIYTVYEPPLKAHESAPNPERFVFVRDGFSFWAFLLAPWWMLRHRLWLALTGYVILAIALSVALRFVGASTTVSGIVVGDDLESAERRFFDAWVNKSWVNKSWADPSAADGAPRQSSPAMGVAMARRPSSEVIGLFPQPGAPR